MDWLTTTHTSAAGPMLRDWQRLSASRWGRWLFARELSRRSPYLRTIRPQFRELRPTLCTIALRKRRRVENRLGAVHPLAMGNLCELAASLVTDVTIPATLRATSRGMTIEYLRAAETDVIATARLDRAEWHGAESIAVPVSVTDTQGVEVVRAVVSVSVFPVS
jgi:acyl-coenzyme A thioesterase PaaI-like protein